MAPTYTDGRDLAGLIQELTARSVGEQALALQRYRELLEQVAAGKLDPSAVRVQYDRLVAEQSAQFARDIATLGARYYEGVLELNRAYVERLFDQVAGAARVPPHPHEPHPHDRRAGEPIEDEGPSLVALSLQGQLGTTAEASFLIENKRSEPADVVFLLSDFARAGGEPFRAELELDPPRFSLDPYAERPVTLRLRLDPQRFEAGYAYHAEVLIRGTDELMLQLTVNVVDQEPVEG
jgi:hypothetical protein